MSAYDKVARETFDFYCARDGVVSAIDSIRRCLAAYRAEAFARKRFGRREHYRVRYIRNALAYRKLLRDAIAAARKADATIATQAARSAALEAHVRGDSEAQHRMGRSVGTTPSSRPEPYRGQT